MAAGFDSQRTLASAMKVSHTTVGNWERGVNMPRPAQVRALAKKLNDPELLELTGLTSEPLTFSAERLDRLERSVKKLEDEVARLRRQFGRG